MIDESHKEPCRRGACAVRMREGGEGSAARRHKAREVLFLVSVWLKGIDGFLELIGGLALLAVTPGIILRVVRFVTQDEITEDPRDLVANALRHFARHLTFATEHFMAAYLLVHGVVKILLVWALLARALVAYPVSMVIFAAFVVYQLYRYTFTHGTGLLLLSALDVAVIVLVLLEYRALRLSSQRGEPAARSRPGRPQHRD